MITAQLTSRFVSNTHQYERLIVEQQYYDILLLINTTQRFQNSIHDSCMIFSLYN